MTAEKLRADIDQVFNEMLAWREYFNKAKEDVGWQLPELHKKKKQETIGLYRRMDKRNARLTQSLQQGKGRGGIAAPGALEEEENYI